MSDPRVATVDNWPPDYSAVLSQRAALLTQVRKDPNARATMLMHYKTNPKDFILDWGMTYDPRNAGGDIPTLMPFNLFARQSELVDYLHGCVLDQENGLVEKCRDAGATWVACAFSVWMWIFQSGSSIGFGSRKELLVDRIGDPDSIFEKLRQIINYLPSDIFWPKGFKPDEHMPFMKIINPENGATIVGEAGDNIGRGGRKSLYFKDESSHYARPELIEAALGDNTNVQIDISSVNGPGNVFHRRRQSGTLWTPDAKMPRGATRVFIFDWRDDPRKDDEWFARRREKAEREGLLPQFNQEVLRDYNSAVANVLIPGAWVNAAVGFCDAVGYEPTGSRVAAMDVADGGADVNALALRKGIELRALITQGAEAEVAGRAMYVRASSAGCREFWYEVNGVGAGARAGATQVQSAASKRGPTIHAWNPSSAVLNPAGCIHTGVTGPGIERRNRDHYGNYNAQSWWALRERFRKTYETMTGVAFYDMDDLISLPANLENLEQLKAELSQPVYSTNVAGKILVDKQPKGTKSPNLADAVKICFAPKRQEIEEEDLPGVGVGPVILGEIGIA